MTDTQLPNLITCTSTTTGTGSLVLSGSVPYADGAGGLVDGQQYAYYAHYDDLSTAGYEQGVGVWTAGTQTLTRATIIKSSNSPENTAVSFSGATLRVSIVAPTEIIRGHQRLFPEQDPFYPVVLVWFGQSNHVGFVTESPADMPINNEVFDWQRTHGSPLPAYSFKVADPSRTDSGYFDSPYPLGSDPIVGMIGNDYGNMGWFCSDGLQREQNKRVYMIQVGLGATDETYYDPTTSPQGAIFTALEAQVTAALAVLDATWPGIKVTAACMHQGESSILNGTTPTEWARVFTALRDQSTWFTDNYTQLLVGGLADNLSYWGGLTRFVQESSDDTRYVSSAGLDAFDGLHFPFDNLREMGRRYKRALITGPKDKPAQCRDAEFIDWVQSVKYDPLEETATSPENQESGAKRGYRFDIDRALTNPFSTIMEWLLNGTTKAKMYITGAMELARLDLTHTTTSHTDSTPDPFIDLQGEHTYDFSGALYGMTLPPVVWVRGKSSMARQGNLFGTQQLFQNTLTVTNTSESPQISILHGTFSQNYMAMVFEADNGHLTNIRQTDNVVVNTIRAKNGGSYTFNDYVTWAMSLQIGNDATVTRRVGVEFNDAVHEVSPCNGVVVSQAGIAVANLTFATNNTELLYGTITVPSGDYGLYQASTKPNRFNGGIANKIRQTAENSPTITTADHTIVAIGSNAKTPELPDIDSVDDGQEFIFYQKGTGGITVQGTTSKSPQDPITGPTGPAAQYGALHVRADKTDGDWITWT